MTAKDVGKLDADIFEQAEPVVTVNALRRPLYQTCPELVRRMLGFAAVVVSAGAGTMGGRGVCRAAAVHKVSQRRAESWDKSGPIAQSVADEELELSRKLKQDGPDADLVEVVGKAAKALENDPDAGLALEALPELIDQLEVKMKEAAKKLDFEEAANLRDRVKQLRQKMAGSH